MSSPAMADPALALSSTSMAASVAHENICSDPAQISTTKKEDTQKQSEEETVCNSSGRETNEKSAIGESISALAPNLPTFPMPNASIARAPSELTTPDTFLLAMANVTEQYGTSIFSSSNVNNGAVSSSPATTTLLSAVTAASTAGGVPLPPSTAALGTVPCHGEQILAHHPISSYSHVNAINSMVPGTGSAVTSAFAPAPYVPVEQHHQFLQPPHTNSLETTLPCFSAFASCESDTKSATNRSNSTCPSSKQHQLPMFLSKTYHMIDRCDPNIATWSVTGDNFVVKNAEKFASCVLPQYFKHSNFSSFARQLNFYGFRKLKAEPILTADFDARTASYVRFYHAKFQKDKPTLLQGIKRATKSDQQSKDDVDCLREEIVALRQCLSNTETEYGRKLAEVVADSNRKINQLWTEFENMSKAIKKNQVDLNNQTFVSAPSQLQHVTTTGPSLLDNYGHAYIPAPGNVTHAPVAAFHPSMHFNSHPAASVAPPIHANIDMMQSLSHVAGVKLQSPSVQSQTALMQPSHMPLTASVASGTKRDAESSGQMSSNISVIRQRTTTTNMA